CVGVGPVRRGFVARGQRRLCRRAFTRRLVDTSSYESECDRNTMVRHWLRDAGRALAFAQSRVVRCNQLVIVSAICFTCWRKVVSVWRAGVPVARIGIATADVMMTDDIVGDQPAPSALLEPEDSISVCAVYRNRPMVGAALQDPRHLTWYRCGRWP